MGLARRWKKEYPQFSQNINYWIAKIASDKRTHIKHGKKAIAILAIIHQPIELKKAKELEKKLKN